jgi:hypothetical protein
VCGRGNDALDGVGTVIAANELVELYEIYQRAVAKIINGMKDWKRTEKRSNNKIRTR